MMGVKLDLFKPVVMISKYDALLVTPENFCPKLFSHYNAGPSGGHMGEYKMIFYLRS